MTAIHSLHSLLAPERVRVGLRAESKTELLLAMVGLACGERSELDAEQLLDAVETRERLISTGVGQGLALPHARTDAVPETIAALAILASPVDFESLDGAPVRIVLLLAGPEGERKAHLRLLSRVSRIMADEGTREKLLHAQSVRDVLNAVADAEDAIA